ERGHPVVSSGPRGHSGRPASDPRSGRRVRGPRRCRRGGGPIHPRTGEGSAERADPLPAGRAPRAERPLVSGGQIPQPRDAPPAEPTTDLPSLAKAFAAIEEDVEPPASSMPSDFQSFVESIEPENEDTHVLLQLAELAIEGGDPQMGLLRYEQAIERDPRNAD